jgi:hypothetical protein
MRGEKAI